MTVSAQVRAAVRQVIARQRASRGVLVSDTTLRDGEQMPGVAFGAEDKVEIARALERAGVHSIDAGFAAAGPDEAEAVRRVAAAVERPVVMSLARTRPADVDRAAEALEARSLYRKGVSLFCGTSPLHREHKLGMDRAAVLRAIEESVGYAAERFAIVAFSAEDASRTEPDFLCECFRVAIDAGATSVSFPDTVGVLLPAMAAEMVKRVQDGVPNVERALLAAHFHDDLGLAVANTLAAVEAGAHVAQCTVNGIGERAGNAALEEVALALALHADRLGRGAEVDTTALTGLCELVAARSGVPPAPHKAVSGANVFATEAGVHQDGLLKDPRTYQPFPPERVGARPGFRIALGKHSGRHGLAARVQALGVTLDEPALDALLARIKALPRPADGDRDDVLLRMAAEAASPPPGGGASPHLSDAPLP